MLSLEYPLLLKYVKHFVSPPLIVFCVTLNLISGFERQSILLDSIYKLPKMIRGGNPMAPSVSIEYLRDFYPAIQN